MRPLAKYFVNRAQSRAIWIGENRVTLVQKPRYLDYPISAKYLTSQYLPAHRGWFAGRGMAMASGDWLGSGAVSSAGSFTAVVAQAAVLVANPKVRKGA